MSVTADQFKGRTPEEKRALLAQMLREKASAEAIGRPARRGAALPTIVPAPEQWHQPFPLTDIQQAYWVGRSMAYELGDVSIHAYSEVDCVDLDLERLEGAWRRVVARHAMLRAVVLPDGRQQVLEQVPPYEFPIYDLRGQDPQAAAATLETVREQLSHQVVRAEEWPGFDIRASLLDDGRTRLHISIDLLHCDGGSLMILNDEWVRLYQEPHAELEPLALSYRDYVLAGLELQESDLYRRSLEYWQQRVAELPPAPELPVAHTPGSLGRTRFTHRSAQLDRATWDRLKAQAARLGLTPSAVLLTAYAEILAAWSAHPDFTVNVTLFNRLPLHPQVNAILGDFTSMILLAVANPARATFEARALQVQKRLWTDLEHRYVSGVQALRELARLRGPNASAMMPIVFTSLLDLGTQGFCPPSVSLSKLGEIVYSVTQTPQVWLDHQVLEEHGALVLHWDAVEEIFPAGLLDDMLGAYRALLERLAESDAAWQDTRHTHIPAEQLARIAAVNATDAPMPAGTLRTLFVEQAARQPHHLALISSARTLTYDELARRANQLGRRLRELGARPNTLIAVVMEKGWEQVVATLGIHAAGAAYLPVDPSLPTERLWYLLENGQARIAVTQSWVEGRLDWPAGVERICLDTDELAGVDDRPLEPLQRPEDLSHVIYTSGSTGLPKGVMVEHRNVVNRMADVNLRFGAGPGDRVLALTALHHDLSVYDIFGMLMAGGTIVLPDAAGAREPAHWAELLAREEVTVWNSVPAFLEMLVEHLEHRAEREDAPPLALRWAILAGDWIPVTLPDRLRALVPEARLIASGGPTETTIWDIWYPVGVVAPSWKSIPYGKPMANARYYVLNEALEPCPEWAPGQLYIGGAGLARGYFGRPDLTAERFVPDPFATTDDRRPTTDDEQAGAGGHQWSVVGGRLYRSGDLGRYLPDGNIEFLGREDFQVKIRGYRIELGEVEAALAQHPAVRAAVVDAVGEQRGHKRLVAYVVPAQPYATNGHKPRRAEDEKRVDDYVDFQIDEVELLDPVARIEFKLSEKGIRRESDRPVVQFERPARDEALLQLYAERRSQREFSPAPIPLAQLAGLLASLYQIEMDGLPKYRYASGGGLYPVQTYLYVKPGRVEGLAAGTYYYNPKEHQLALLTADAQIDRSAHAPNNRTLFDKSAFSIFLVGQLKAITPMYGRLDRDFCLVEAGYMSQLLMMAAQGGPIGLCPIGDMKFDSIRHLFALEDSHIFVHSLLGGGAAQPAAGWSAESWRTSIGVPTADQRPTTNDQPAPSSLVGELRAFLQSKLPEQMVPASFVLLDALPLTPNGKVNRKALPAPDEAPAAPEESYAPPRTDIERTLTEIVRGVLRVERVGIDSNFFDLGGNSVHMVQILNKLRDAFQRDVPVTEVFRHPTISSLAAYLSQAEDERPSFAQSDERADRRRASRARRRS